MFRVISGAPAPVSGRTVAEQKKRHAQLYSEITSLAADGEGAWQAEQWWLRLRELTCEFVDHTLPLRRIPVSAPATCGPSAAAAFVESILRNEHESLAAAVVDCLRFRAMDAALNALQHFPQIRPELDLRNAFTTTWKLLPIYRAAASSNITAALRLILLPYDGPAPLTLYRGQTRADYEAGIYRYSWTTKPTSAWRYATYHKELGLEIRTVILEAVAPRDAIICAFDDRDAEVVVDPALLDIRLKESLG